jgi:hypothetical protein
VPQSLVNYSFPSVHLSTTPGRRGGVEVQLTVFLISALYGGEWSTSCLGHFVLGEYLKICINSHYKNCISNNVVFMLKNVPINVRVSFDNSALQIQ